MNAPAWFAVRIMGIQVQRIVRYRGAGMTMADPVVADPFGANITVRERIKHQTSRFHVAADIEDLLLSWIIHLEDDVAMIQGHAKGQAARLGQNSHGCYTAKILRPHIHVYFQARHNAGLGAQFQRPLIKIDNFAVADQRTIGAMRQNLHIVNAGAEAACGFHVRGQQIFVLAQAIEPAATQHRQAVFP